MEGEEVAVDASQTNLTGNVTGSPSPSLPAQRRDSEVLQALAAKDRAAAAELLVALHAKAVGRVCLALLGQQTDAEDALQETLLSALNGLESFRNEGTLRAWLLSIARRCCARRIEARARERDARRSLPAPEAEAPALAERLSMARRARLLLEEIRPTEREALVLRYAAELSFREVGQACGVDEATARKRVSRGLVRLRALLGEDKS